MWITTRLQLRGVSQVPVCHQLISHNNPSTSKHPFWILFQADAHLATDAEARPTPRAVKERLSKIKDMAKLAGPKGLTSPTAAPSPKNKGESKSKEGDTGSQVSPHKRSRTTPSNKKKKDEPVETDEAENAEDDQPRSDEC